ncbi:MAG: CoB--CoM heterodisulfide reductase iron-sulfur subunit B family protein [Acidobacteria bacterium]|nr:CoB--CoM heterodisulfide reductase iron-sulfur subunit B family protein [Acidobacteriota bacterium]
MSSRIALYPGCSLEGTSSSFETSVAAVFEKLGIEYDTLKDWNCCGATSAHALDHELYMALNLRNLSLAEEQGYEEIFAPCAACYHRLASANLELSNNADLADALKSETGLNYRGSVKVRNVLDLLTNVVGRERIEAAIEVPLSGIRVACYYGCLNTRIPRSDCFDDREYPMSMDRIVTALGAEVIDWSYKTECCGASLFMTAPAASAKLCGRILKDAEARDVNCIAVACPLCQNNLDAKQEEIRAKAGIPRAIPVVFITQLMGLAYGIDERHLQLESSIVPFNLKPAGATT